MTKKYLLDTNILIDLGRKETSVIKLLEKINIEEELVAQGSQVAELPEFTLFRDFGLIIVQIHSFGFFS